eukprot:1484013-Amphidinium_carterae.1
MSGLRKDFAQTQCRESAREQELLGSNPIVGFLPFVLLWVAYFGCPEKGLFGSMIPAAAVACVLGVVLNLAAQTRDWDAYSDVRHDVKESSESDLASAGDVDCPLQRNQNQRRKAN